MWFFFEIQHPLSGGGNPYLFQTAWFTVGLTTQTLIIHMIRTSKIPIIQSRPAYQMLLSTLAAVVLAISVPYLPIAMQDVRVSYPVNTPDPINIINPSCPDLNATLFHSPSASPSPLNISLIGNFTTDLNATEEVSNCTGTITVNFLSMVPLPPIFYAFLVAIFFTYCIIVQVAKILYLCLFNGEWL